MKKIKLKRGKKYKLLINFILIIFSNDAFSLENENKVVKFNTNLLAEFNKNIDISWLENEYKPMATGQHNVAVSVNGVKFGVKSISFIRDDEAAIKPCMPILLLKRANVDLISLKKIDNVSCIVLEKELPGAKTDYDYDEDSIEVTIPQVYLKEVPEGYIDPALWEEGINAFSTNYTLSSSNFFQKGNKTDTAYFANFFSILRMNQWRFYSYDTFDGGNGRNNKINHLQAYAKRPLRSLRAELSLGDFSSVGERFPTVALRGIALQTDERMFPWTQKGYAPIINGIANSNAVVTISQNGNILHEQNVPPGEFRITDLYALGYGGDLTVQVKESNGKTVNYTVPYSNLPEILRKGYFKYSLLSGKLIDNGLKGNSVLNEGTIHYGLTNNLTLFGGLQYVSDNTYKSINSGVAFNTSLGAISAEMTQSWSSDIEELKGGNAFKNRSLFKLSLAKALNNTGTNFHIASYYLTGKNYYNVADAFYKRRQLKKNELWDMDRYKNRFEAVLSQQLPDVFGKLSLTFLREQGNYSIKNNDKRISYLFGYRNHYRAMNYSIGVNKSYLSDGNKETQYYLNLSMPFGFKKTTRPSLNVGLSYNSDDTSVRTSINGTAQHDSSTSSFSSYFSQSSKHGSDFGISFGNTDAYLQKNINYSQSMSGYAVGGNLSGGLLIHPDGIQFSAYLPDTVALIEAKGAEGGSVSGNKHSRIDKKGYAISGSITPYQENTILLETKGTSLGFDSAEDSQVVIPTVSSVVKKVFNNKNERALVVKVKDVNNKWLPFGSTIYSKEKLVGTLSQGGMVLLELDNGDGRFNVKAKRNGVEFTCNFDIEGSLPSSEDNYQFNIITCK